MTRLAPVGGDRWAGMEGIHQRRFHLAYRAEATRRIARQAPREHFVQLRNLRTVAWHLGRVPRHGGYNRGIVATLKGAATSVAALPQ